MNLVVQENKKLYWLEIIPFSGGFPYKGINSLVINHEVDIYKKVSRYLKFLKSHEDFRNVHCIQLLDKYTGYRRNILGISRIPERTLEIMVLDFLNAVDKLPTVYSIG